MAELFRLVKYYNLPRFMNYGNYMDLYGIYMYLWYFEDSQYVQIFSDIWLELREIFAVDIHRFDFDLWYGLCRYYDDSCWFGRLGSCSYQTPRGLPWWM